MIWVRFIGVIAGFIGLAWVAHVVEWSALSHALATGGITTVLIVATWHVVGLALDAQAWRLLMPKAWRLPFRHAVLLRWIASSVNALLPVAQVGGDVIRARLLAWRSVPIGHAGANVSADVALMAYSQLPFALVGVALAVSTAWAAIAWLIVAVTLVWCFWSIKPSRVDALLKRLLASAVAAGGGWRGRLIGVAQAAAGGGIDASGAWRTFCLHGFAWGLGAGEIYLGMYGLGVPITLGDALMVEALLQAIRSGVFFVPAAIGIQETGIVALVTRTGAPAEVGVAYALVRRGRELLVGLPGLIAWQWCETRQAARGPMSSQPEDT
ncbi:MAG: hypothetical protein HOI95_16995 [Chromatiales bacterium]|nr:hypothetical protein [Chromatiales bacterium]